MRSSFDSKGPETRCQPISRSKTSASARPKGSPSWASAWPTRRNKTASSASSVPATSTASPSASATALSPVVFAGTLKMEFSTKPQTVTDGLASKDFGRVVVKYGGTDPFTGASRSSTEDLGFVLDYGKQDWQEVALALREFVSNAIDRSIREKGDWSGVKIEIVDEAQVRAKRDHTRVFVPMNAEVLEFFNNLGKWFLHFSEPESLSKAILPKTQPQPGRPQGGGHLPPWRPGPGVRVAATPSRLFDYNLDDLTIDEARKASDWDVKHHCGKALANADKNILALLFDRLINTDKPAWEFGFDTYSLQPAYRDSAEDELRKQQNWQEAFAQVAGEDAVLTGKGSVDQLERKGYKPVTGPGEPRQCRRAVRRADARPASCRPTSCRAGRSPTRRPTPRPLSISSGNCSKKSA